MFARFVQWLRASIVRQFLVVFGTIGLLSVLVATPAIVLTELSTGSGGAINVSGSLRMQSYKLALAVADPFTTYQVRQERTQKAWEEFGAKLASPGLLNGVRRDSDDAAYSQYLALKTRFENEVQPLAKASGSDLQARKRFVEAIPSFVGEVDTFVQTLENGLNNRLNMLRWLLIAILLGAVGVSFLMLRVMQQSIFAPLLEIEAAADAVRQGNFSVRAKTRAPNEIGRLSASFNYMVDVLGRLYGNLESEVERKTRDLNRRNDGLQLLSTVTQTVSWTEELDRETVGGLLDEACRKLGASCAMVTLGEGDAAHVLAKSSGWREACESGDVLSFGLVSNNPAVGTLSVRFGDGAPEGWQQGLAEALAHTIGRGIERSMRQMDDRRLAVLEERSTIARELHDSIAQSLSYSRIQMHRLKVFVERGEPREKLLETVTELSEGISTAYAQLREVLTAFRLQISSAGLNGAVEETVEEFRNRTGIAVTVTNSLLGYELNPNEQVHVVHILREALINVEKHARATHVSVGLTRYDDTGFVLTVEDNGIGLPDRPQKHRHFGLSIMSERAEALRGSLELGRVETRGTRVVLTVPGRQAVRRETVK